MTEKLSPFFHAKKQEVNAYVSAVPEGFKEYYHGPQDIPPEHRIFAYPEKAEPVHSILAALKRFQEAPPAPKKDKAGPSHEER